MHFCWNLWILPSFLHQFWNGFCFLLLKIQIFRRKKKRLFMANPYSPSDVRVNRVKVLRVVLVLVCLLLICYVERRSRKYSTALAISCPPCSCDCISEPYLSLPVGEFDWFYNFISVCCLYMYSWLMMYISCECLIIMVVSRYIYCSKYTFISSLVHSCLFAYLFNLLFSHWFLCLVL